MKSFFNKNGGYIAAFAFVIAAGVFVSAVNKKTPEKNVHREETKIEEPVLKNKNKPKKTEIPKKNVQPKKQEPVRKEPVKQNNPQPDKNASVDVSLTWPVDGEIIMEYSPSAMIFDPTLEQYRTSDSVCIAAAVGTDVKAVADGKVKEVVNDVNGGNYVVVDHGGGWETSCGELDEINVAEGDTVEKGQTIGVVAEPSVYSCELGDHVEFKVTLDDMSVNPSEAVAKGN